MIDTKLIKQTLKDWNSGQFTTKQIQEMHGLTRSQQFAICFGGKELTPELIEERIKLVSNDMLSQQILNIMRGVL